MGGNRSSAPVEASEICYEGAMIAENAAGYAQALAAGDLRFLGHAIKKADNGSGSAGDKNVELLSGRYTLMATLTADVTDVGRPVYASDDQTLSMIGAAAAATHTYVGVMTRYVSSTTCEVEFRTSECDEFGWGRIRELLIDDKTVDAADNGKIFYLGTDTKTVTLLATVAGMEITVVQCGGDGDALIHVDPNANDLFLGGQDHAAGGDGKKLSNTKATARRGDYLKLRSDGSTGWQIEEKRGTWAQEA